MDGLKACAAIRARGAVPDTRGKSVSISAARIPEFLQKTTRPARHSRVAALLGLVSALLLVSGRGLDKARSSEKALRVSYAADTEAEAQPIREAAGNGASGFTEQAVTNRTGGETKQAGSRLPARAVRQIQSLLSAKVRRTPAQRKVSSQLLDTRRKPRRKPTAAGIGRLQETDREAKDERVMVDIRADVTPAVLTRIRELGGTVINSVPKYQAMRAQIPLRAVVRLAALDEVRTIRPADEARTRGQAATLSPASRTRAADAPVTKKDNTSQGDVAHRANSARRTHKVDGTGIGVGVIANGVQSLADRQATDDLPARITVLPDQEGSGDEGTALLEIVHDLAPGAELYFATGNGGEARMAENIEALCEAGANVIVDDIGYALEAVFQDGIVSKGVNAAVADGCFFFSAGGNDGNLTYGTTGVWEGDYAAGTSLVVDGETVGIRHDFGGGVEANEVRGSGARIIVLQWADPLGASANDYDLFLVNEDGDVIASSTDTQDGTQDPIEVIRSPGGGLSGLSVVVVKASGSDRYLRVHAFDGRLGIQTAGNLYGHAAAENAVVVAMVDVRTAAGSGRVFNGTESVRTSNSDGPRRIFFEPDGTAITAGNFSSTGGQLLQKPDLTAATCVRTATPGFSTFCGTSSAAPHATAIAALMLEAAGGPNQVTLAQLRTGMTTGAAVLDIEASGVDRDSGAGIVMAPGSVDAVDVAEADRNGAPTVENAESDRTFAPGGDAVDIDLEDVFDDPDDDTLTYEAVSSDPDRLTITRSNAQVTITPGSPGRVMVRLRAIDPDGLSVTDSFSVTVTAGNRDYDSDNDGLIDIANLAQLDALRYDLNGDGLVDGAIWMPYYTAYPMGALGMGCPSDGCAGYELTEDLDFDTDDDGDVDSDDDYWNGGDGWEPIGEADTPFTADFMGNRQTVSNLFIDRDTENEVGLFGAVDSNRISGVSLAGADVTGRHAVGSLLGAAVYVATFDNHATGQVSGQDEVGGLVGRTWGSVWYSSASVNVSGNDAVGGLVGHQTLNPTVASRATGQVSGQDEVGGLVGRAGGAVWHSSAAVNVSGNDAVGGLVGHQTLNPTVASYATGNVEGMEAVGGLVGAVSDVNQIIEASYATGNVSGRGARLTDSDSGFIICDLVGTLTVSGPVEATTSSGGGIGGLVGSSCGWIEVSYATGAVSGTTAVGGLVGSGRFAKPRSSYWDLETSGVRVGVGEDDANDNGVIDGTERVRLGVAGKTTAELQTPTDYTGIYEGWNVDLGNPVFEDGEPDDPWDFGTATQYAVLSLDLNDDNRATWQEAGYQVRTSLTLRAATTANQAQVVLSWDALSTTSWSPAPDVSYTLYRDDGATVEAVQTDFTGLTHTDTGVTIGDRYTYWVAAVLDGGEAARSAPVSVTAGGANQAPAPVGILPDRQLTVGSMAVDVDVASAFQDPDNDTLTYGASSSLTSVATLSRSGSVVTITPVAAGRTIITVTATDVSGSGMSASQRFRVTVGHDYDTDGDGLIGVSKLAQLDAMRHDLDGNGDAGTVVAYAAAFPSPFDRMGCGVNGCSGYELLADLDFDTDGDGAVDSDDDYWNDGDGWEPIGWDSTDEVDFSFNTTFDGNQHTLSNLFTAGRGYSGLFGRIGRSGVVRDVTLSDVNVSGTEVAGALVGENQGLLIGIQSSGQVSGELHVGGLVGYNTGFVVYSHATGRVTSDRDAGGLVGYHQSNLISASYATGPVTGAPAGGLVGTIGTPFQEATIRASYATGSVDGSPAGGLVGHVYDEGMISASYATGRVSGGSRKSGLVGDDEGGTVTNSYWDTRTSGQGSGSPGSGRTTSQLQSPTGYSGIYGSWNLDLNDDGTNNDPWHFETGKYPALRADRDGDDDATWEEFGYQLRSGPTLTATPTTNAGQGQVELEWAEVPLSSAWTPAPGVSYAVTREGDENLEAIAENLTLREYTDTDVAGDETYVYQVVAVVDGGEPVRSATVSVTVAGNKRPVAVGTLRSRWVLVGNSVMTEVGGAFQDPEGDTITYDVSSSDPSVARVTLSGTRVTIIPVAEGRTTITVTATDDGSNQSRSQQFRVTVLSTTTVDYDTDDDGLIEISNLAQLDAVRHDLNGSGRNIDAVHAEAFPDGGDVLACGGLLGCVGYELNADLDFDTDGSGEANAGDAYWNDGAGWVPIGDSSGSFSGFGAIFEGNGRTITHLFIDSSENDIGLFGVTGSSAVIRDLELVSVLVTGTDNVGGLVGSNGGGVSGCYATGKVSGDDVIGGLVGANLDGGSASASYSTVQATGDDRVGGLAGSNRGEVTAAYATGRVVGDAEAGGLLGRNTGDVNVSYATGRVSGRRTIGGLVGWNSGDVKASYATGLVSGGSKIGGLVGDNTRGGTINNSYWDTDTSGPTTVSYGRGQTTANLQAPTDYTGIYQKWNRDLDGDGMNDAPWDFGTPSQYPALSVDTNGVGGATWQEFGQQIRAGPALMATPTVGQVTLTWSTVTGVTYNLYRTSGTTVGILSENTSSRSYVDIDVTAGATYVYQVAAVIIGGEASRSARVTVDVPIPDTTGPTVTRLEIASDAGSDSTYAIGDVIQVTVTFSKTVEVEGTPQLRLRVGSRTRTAGYLSGTGTAALVFGYEVAEGDEDSDGVSIEAGRIALNGGTIKDEADNVAESAHGAVAAQAGHKVDGVRPAFVSAAVDGSSLTLTYGEALDEGSRPAAVDFTVEVDGSGRSVTGVSVSGSLVTLALNPAVEHGDTGIRVSYTVPTGVGANPIRDAVGNDARGLSNRSVTNTTGAPNTAPEITSPSSFDVPENRTVARRLAARDTDPGDEVTGWAIVGGADRFQFSIAPVTGELSFREAPDFEAPGDNQYAVTVEVTSGAGVRELTAEQTLTISVTDEREPPGVPEAPTFSGETAESLTVSWTEPENTGPDITDYDVQYREKGRGRFNGVTHEGPARTLTLSDLEPGTLYELQVRATNEEGTSGWSASGEGMTVTPLTVGMGSGTDPPVSGAFTVRFSFSEPVTGFSRSDIETGQDPACRDDQNNTVFCDPGIGTLQTTDDRVFTTTVTPWTDRVAHSYTLRLTVPGGAVRSLVGSKPNEEPEDPLEVRVAPPGVTEPISSLGLTVSGGNGSVRLSWNRPSDSGGSAIIRYEYRYQAVGEAWSEWENVGAGTRSVTVGNLINGREYVFEVRAVSALGKGGAETVQATPERRIAPPPPPGNGGGGGGLLFPPEAPAGLMAMPGEGAVRLEWGPPERDGGTAILRYEYRLKEGRGEFGEWTPIEDSAPDEVNATGYTVGELGNGTVYVFELRAVNLVGDGPESEAVEVVMGLDRAYWSNFRAEDLQGGEASLEGGPFGGTPQSLRLRFGAGLRFEESELDGEGEVTETRSGSYGYRYTSRETGELRLDYDVGKSCELRLTFREVGAGSYRYRCGGVLGGQGSFRMSGLNRGPEITGAGVFEVAENQARVGRLEAVDPDEGDGITGYGIAGGADAELFAIVEETGELSFRKAPDYENPSDVESAEPRSGAADNEYIVVVEVRSGEGERERKGERAIRVRVTDEEEPPEITGAGVFEVVENLTRVGRLEAVDSDEGDEIEGYGIAGGADASLFVIEAETGELRFREAPDYENPGDVESAEPRSGAADNEYIVVVEVRSGEGERERKGSRAIRVRVTDEQEPPEITSVGPFEVAENRTRVGQLEAVDQDKQDEITGYGIAGGADGGLFAVESETGELRFREAPDYENPGDVESSDPESGAGDNEYVVVVEVKSGEGERERKGSRAIRVRVTDEEEPPEITGAGVFEVAENQAMVGQLEAVDPDKQDEITGYGIVGGADGGLFAVESETGELRFREAPDYESPSDVESAEPRSGAADNEYIVVVEVKSGEGERERKGSRAIRVRVADEEEPPGAPAAPVVTAEGSGSLKVSWTEPENRGPEIVDYEVRYREGGEAGYSDGGHDGTGLEVRLSGLKEGTVYEVQVRAVNQEGMSEWSEPGEGRTDREEADPEEPDPDDPSDFTEGDLEGSRLRLRLEGEEGAAGSLELRFGEGSRFEQIESGGQQAAARSEGAARSGSYTYERTGPGMGTVRLDYDDGSSCEIRLSFTGTGVGGFAYDCGGGDSAEGSFRLTTGSLFVPVILSAAGRSNSFFTSELTLTNRGDGEVKLDYTYTAHRGGGSGKTSDVLAPGMQKIETDALTYLRGLGIAIPETGNRIGTLRVEARLGSEVEAVVRTTTVVPEGRAGLAYLGVAEEEGFDEAVYLCGLRQNSKDRSNLAFQNMGAEEEGAITLRTTVYSGEAGDTSARILEDVTLVPGGFHQYSGLLGVLESVEGDRQGYVKVERVEGTSPFYAYGVINDQANSDGSFIFPVAASWLEGRMGQTLPVIVETSAFRSELTVTNFSEEPRTLDFRFVADAIKTTDKTAGFSMKLEAGEQRIIPEVVEELRRRGVAGLGSTRGFYAGAVFATAEEGNMSGIVIGARTGSEGGGGSYSVFYNAAPFGSAFTEVAWVEGLQQNRENRSNLALVNTGEVDGSASVFHLEIYDGETGLLEQTVVTKPIPARGWHQINGILGSYAPETRQGYVRILKVSGENPFLAYGVVNDGGAPGERSGDGAYLPARE